MTKHSDIGQIAYLHTGENDAIRTDPQPSRAAKAESAPEVFQGRQGSCSLQGV